MRRSDSTLPLLLFFSYPYRGVVCQGSSPGEGFFVDFIVGPWRHLLSCFTMVFRVEVLDQQIYHCIASASVRVILVLSGRPPAYMYLDRSEIPQWINWSCQAGLT